MGVRIGQGERREEKVLDMCFDCHCDVMAFSCVVIPCPPVTCANPVTPPGMCGCPLCPGRHCWEPNSRTLLTTTTTTTTTGSNSNSHGHGSSGVKDGSDGSWTGQRHRKVCRCPDIPFTPLSPPIITTTNSNNTSLILSSINSPPVTNKRLAGSPLGRGLGAQRQRRRKRRTPPMALQGEQDQILITAVCSTVVESASPPAHDSSDISFAGDTTV
ncbi:hypothetical protein ACOMHN_065940 [Nucella lapillus]